MSWIRRLGRALALPWRPAPVLASAVLEGPGSGLARLLLAALCLTLAFSWLGNGEYERFLEKTPGVLAQLPKMGLRGGKLWTDPPLTEPRLLKDADGRPVLLLDLDGRLRLEDQAVSLQLTRTRLRVKSAEGQVQDFPLAGTGQPDGEVKPAELLDFLRGPGRWLALSVSFPFLLLMALGLLFIEQGILSLMLLVPDRLYDTRLEWAARLRLISLAVLASSQVSALLLLSRLPLGPPWLVPLVLSLAGMFRGLLAVQARQHTGSTGVKPAAD